jgi:AraC-like DNA-binding protein
MHTRDDLPFTTVQHQSPLGDWTHCECTPGRLSGVVEKIWHFEGRVALLRERSFARVYSEIILQLGPRFRDVDASGRAGDLFPESCVGGPTTMASVIEAPHDGCCVMGIQLHAAGAVQLLRAPGSETLNGTISLDDALAGDTPLLAERCHAARTTAARFAIVCQWIESRLSSGRAPHGAVTWASHIMRQRHGSVPIAELQGATSLSKSRFVSVFREHTGLVPKQYARILRFRHALGLLQAGGGLSRVALDAGYFDQAHMYRDFGEFAGMTPAAFVQAARFPGSLSLPE